MPIIVTGAAGFVGYHVSQALLAAGETVVGFDNCCDYYDTRLKDARLQELGQHAGFQFIKGDLADTKAVMDLIGSHKPAVVCHLGAQAGVRYSIDNPMVYAQSNLMGFMNILEACRHNEVEHLVYASSSSVYGMNETFPFSAAQPADHPVSLYAATKRANELMAHSYSHLYGLPTTGLRFFTVYGPWGRPDMAYYSFTEKILAGKPITLFNNGEMRRDFTYIDDVVRSVIGLFDNIPTAGGTAAPDSSPAPWKVFNIGNSQPVALQEFVETIEQACGVKAEVSYAPMQPGDVYATGADCTPLAETVGFKPATPLATGIERFVTWYKDWTNKTS